MPSALRWLFEDPWHYYSLLAVMTFVLGLMLGRAGKTNKLERKVASLRAELSCVLRTIELKKQPEQRRGQ